ncbi:MAG: MBL fold metallo-hydrolase [Lachnospiraceae bacterium]|nr:MBL fold metallo-hydrolase [Lachnospiraceae bacterium]
MKLIFNGAAHEVTGSCHCLEACGKKMLVDFGMEQGKDIYVNEDLPFLAGEIDFVFLTHAHIDHSGMLPLLYRNGYKGPVYATNATTRLCQIMLRDSAHIQESEAEWKNRKNRRKQQPEVMPVYTLQDAEGILKQFVSCDYETIMDIAPGIRMRMKDVGHLLGSASIELWLTEGEETRKIVFSGDIGNTDQPLIKDPVPVEDADYVVMESTYGDRSHDEPGEHSEELRAVLEDTLRRGGNLVIPCFAVGRTQQILYFLRGLKVNHELPGFESVEVYVDSPLAVEATNIFAKNTEECFDAEAMELVQKGINPIMFPGLRLSVTSDESKAINADPKPKVILSASGMCDAGRIRHHLKHNLWRPECTVLFAGYQSEGCLGRTLLDGASEVKLFGETIAVRAKIARMSGISGHADREGLIRWVRNISPSPKQVFVVHGEDAVTDSFAALLRENYGMNAAAPYSGAGYDLITGEMLEEGRREFIKKNYVPKAPGKKTASLYRRLVDAGQKLIAVIRGYQEGTNKDIQQFTQEVENLCDRWKM